MAIMLVAAVLINWFGHPAAHSPPKPAVAHAAAQRYQLGPWIIAVNPDPFTGTVACQIHARDVTLRRDTLIFRVAPGGDTTGTVFRVDLGPAHHVSEAFDTVEAHGFFPQRGWIVDPSGGEVALPTSYVSKASTVTMRIARKDKLRWFKVGQLAAAEAGARAAGCPASL